MKALFIVTFLLWASNAIACDKVISGYEKSDTMFVLCDDLSQLSSAEASDLVIGLFNQYQGPPDEIVIYFVAKAHFAGNSNILDSNLVAFYYTHDNKLHVWPNSKTKHKSIEIIWK